MCRPPTSTHARPQRRWQVARAVARFTLRARLGSRVYKRKHEFGGSSRPAWKPGPTAEWAFGRRRRTEAGGEPARQPRPSSFAPSFPCSSWALRRVRGPGPPHPTERESNREPLGARLGIGPLAARTAAIGPTCASAPCKPMAWLGQSDQPRTVSDFQAELDSALARAWPGRAWPGLFLVRLDGHRLRPGQLGAASARWRWACVQEA